MEYSNPELPEGINTGESNHLKDFVILTTGVIGVIIITLTVLITIVDNFADKIPFEVEQSLPVDIFFKQKSNESLPPYLKNISEKVIQSFDLPEPMKITVHYVNSDTVNAYATLGGHIVLYRGLLEKLKHEDELAMLIAHEVAHVKYRHPILSVSHGIVMGVVMSLLSTSAGTSAISDLMGHTGMVTLMQYSREYEYQSDKDAIQAIVKIYGHAEGARGLFEVLNSVQKNNEPIELFSTHPLTDNRIIQANQMNKKYSEPNKAHNFTPLSAEFESWLISQKEKNKLSIRKQ